MRKETVATAIVFFAVGFLAGYITDAQMNWSAKQRAPMMGQASSSEMPASGLPGAQPAGTMSQGLPEGHPPIETAAIIKQLEDMAAQNPKDPDPALKLANFLYDQRQYAPSIQWYQKALALDPKNVNARTDLGTAYFYTGRSQDALKEYHKSLEMDPKHEPTLLNMVVVNLEGTHDLAAAQQAWDRLHKINPSHPALESLKQKLDAARASGGRTPSSQ
jgi:cytochrome c-type biogenesis protein CcmH/NrfG